MFKWDSFLKNLVLNWNSSDSLISENVYQVCIYLLYCSYHVIIYFIPSDYFSFIFVSYMLVNSRQLSYIVIKLVVYLGFQLNEYISNQQVL
jgi:hypothetical protein